MQSKSIQPILAGDRAVPIASVYSPISARMAQDLGFRCGIVGGSVASMALLGSPDLSLLTQSELVDFVRRITAASNLPILVDGDAGYGNALNSRRLVQELERVGAAAVTLEDSDFPVRYKGHLAAQTSAAEHVDKLKAALDARQCETFSLIARTRCLPCDDIGAVVERVAAYEATGVDAICLFGIESNAHLLAIQQVTAKPLMLISYAGAQSFTPQNVGQVRLLLRGHQPFNDAIVAAYNAYLGDAAGTLCSAADLIDRYCRKPEHEALLKRFVL